MSDQTEAQTECRWCNYVNHRLDDIRDQRDWGHLEDFAASWPSTWLIEKARRKIATLLRPTTPSPNVLPGGDGGPAVQFTWHKNNWHLTIEVSPSDTEMMAWRPGDNPADFIYGTLDKLHLDALDRILDDLEAAP